MKWSNLYSSFALLPSIVSHAAAAPEFIAARQLREAVQAIGKRQSPAPAVQVDLEYFANMPSSEELKWKPCYDDVYFCARLTVPLDYANPDRGSVQLALVKYPAEKTAEYKGTLYLQYGPGGPATNLVLQFGPSFQKPDLLGYDIIGWDVRGAGQSTPTLKCFPDESARAAFLATTPKVLGDPNVGVEEGIKNNLAFAEVFGEACKKESGAFLPYYDTPNNARDLHTIMRATGAKKVTAFWGYAYASLIGETFAALYPDSYDHLILDGVVQGEKQYGFGDTTPSTIRDAEKTFQVFFDSCAEAGPAGCPFYAETPALVRARYEKVRAKLIASPIPVPPFGEFGYSELIRLLSEAIAIPTLTYQYVASLLAEAEIGVAGNNLYGFFAGAPLKPLVNEDTTGSFEYFLSVRCLDHDPYRINSPEEFVPYLKRMLKTSEVAGSALATVQLTCAGAWPTFPLRADELVVESPLTFEDAYFCRLEGSFRHQF